MEHCFIKCVTDKSMQIEWLCALTDCNIHNFIVYIILIVVSFSFRSVCASNLIQIQPQALEPVDSSTNIMPLDTAAF